MGNWGLTIYYSTYRLLIRKTDRALSTDCIEIPNCIAALSFRFV